ncbi:MAG: PKD domain-containing protein, partial [Saprospiraceae bacterium]|nr:PKD domain-containing protein [Saprospiraceae bacterium]
MAFFLLKALSIAQSVSFVASPGSVSTVCASPGQTVSFSGTFDNSSTATSFNFNGGALPVGWTSSPFVVSGATCPGQNSPDNTPYFWATSVDPVTLLRYVATTGVNVPLGGSVQFYMRYGNNEAGGCERPDLPTEEIWLQYSTDNGNSWTTIYDQWDTSPLGSFAWYNWYYQSIAIPPGAFSANTQFRWYQASNSGTPFDNWGIEDVSITANLPLVTITNWAWNFGDGTTGNGQSVNHIFPLTCGSATYNVTLTATASNGATYTSSIPYNVTITPVAAAPLTITESSLIPNDGTVCSGTTVTVSHSGGNSYIWSNGATTSSITATPSSTTSYTVTVSDICGCTSTLSTTVTVLQSPTASISVTETSGSAQNDGLICSGASALLTASGGSQFQWNTGATTSSLTVSPSVTTTYSVSVTNTSSCSANASRTIIVSPPPAVFTVTGGGGYCIGTDPGTKVGLSGSQSGVSYQLQLNGVNTGAALAGTGTTLDFGYQSGVGTYSVIGTATGTGCSSNMTGTVSVFSMNCSATISDPCICLNNATSLSNGQFGEQVKINAPSNQTWTVSAVNGLFRSASAAPPAAPSPITVGTVLTGIGGNMFTLDGRHIDALGYTVSVTNGIGTTLSIGNSCSYPNPAITSNLAGPFCLSSDAVALTGDPGDANIVSQTFRVNGVTTNTFDPSAGVGTYVIEYTVNGGTPKANGANDPGCVQSVSQTVQVLATPAVLTCNDLIHLSLDADCSATIGGDDVLEGSYGCYDDYVVELDRTLPYGNGPWTSATVTSSDIGKTYQYRVTHLISGNRCWGDIKIEDKIAPTVTCASITLFCPITNYTPGALS